MEKTTDIASSDMNTQRRFANLLFSGSWYGLFLLLVTFGIYLSGSLKPYMPLEKLPSTWTSPASEFMQQHGIPAGWGWLNMVKHGDFLTFPAILVLLSLATISSLTLIPAFVRRKEWLHLIALLLLIALMCLAASGAA